MMWINASELYNWSNGDQLLDWLDMYGAQKGLAQNDPDPNHLDEADINVFTREKGRVFEVNVLSLIQQSVDVTVINGAAGNHDTVFEQTQRLLSEGQEAIYQGLVRDEARKVFGVPDLIIIGSAIEKLVPGTVDGAADDYYSVDIKHTGLKLNKKGDLGAKHGWAKVQLSIYEDALSKMLDRPVQRAYVLGRSTGEDGGGCFDALGWLKPGDEKMKEVVDSGLDWIIDLREQGASWDFNQYDDERMLPNPKSRTTTKWSTLLNDTYGSNDEPDPNDPMIVPERIEANRRDWIKNKGLEFYVDFETLSNLNDSFSQQPKVGGTPMIFMIGCGHEEDGEFKFEVWIAEQETLDEETEIIDEWVAHMEVVRSRLAPDLEDPLIFHWHHAETTAMKSPIAREGKSGWTSLNWYDLLAKVMRKGDVNVRGAEGRSLKPVTKSMKEMGLIETVWGESQVSGGTEAMVGAWWCYKESSDTGTSVYKVAPEGKEPLMPQIRDYNEVDCKAMWEILRFLRKNH